MAAARRGPPARRAGRIRGAPRRDRVERLRAPLAPRRHVRRRLVRARHHSRTVPRAGAPQPRGLRRPLLR